METQVFTYWIEITGKAPRKRNCDTITLDIGHCALGEELSIKGSKERAQVVADKAMLRDARYRAKRTVVTRCEYPDGTVTHLRPMFDVNFCVLESGELSATPRKRK